MAGNAEPRRGALGRRRRSPGETRIPIWFGPVFGLFGLVFLVVGIGLVRDELRLADEGVGVAGTIVHLDVDLGTGDDADTYWAVYEFTTSTSPIVTGRSQVSAGQFRTLAVGGPVLVAYLPADPAANRLGSPEFQPFPSVLAVVFGLLFTLIGVGLTWTAVRQRRATAAGATAAGATAGLPTPDAAGRYRFTRSPMRIIVDLVAAPFGALLFLGAAAFMFGQIASDPALALGVVVFGFFGLLMAAGSVVTIRRGVGSTMLRIGPDGIWTPELGDQPWGAIRVVTVEENLGFGGSSGRAATYRRLGIHPRDPAFAARAPGGVARGMTGAFLGFARLVRPGVRTPDLAALAPFGVNAYELEQPIDGVVPLIGRYVPVLDADGRVIAGPGWAEDADRSDAAPMSASAAPAVGFVATTPAPALALARDLASARELAAQAFDHRDFAVVGAAADLFRAALFVALPLIFATVFVAAGPRDEIAWFLAFGLLPLVLVTMFLLVGIPAVLAAFGRLAVARDEDASLVVDESGIEMAGMGRLRWGEIAAVRVGDADVVEGRRGARRDRPRLEIVPRDLRRLDRRRWAARAYDRFMGWRRRLKPWGDRTPRPGAFALDLDLLDADPDEVIDLIARYRVVDEE